MYYAESSACMLSAFLQIVNKWHTSRWASPVIQTASSSRAFVPPGAQKALTKFAPPQPDLQITATDPFTCSAYTQRTGQPCLELSFAEVADGKLPEGRIYDLVVCSFALHLVENASALWSLLRALSECAHFLVVISPHKNPFIKEEWGWRRLDPQTLNAANNSEVGGDRGDGAELVAEKVRLRLYRNDKM